MSKELETETPPSLIPVGYKGADRIEMVPLSRLTKQKRNPRTHSSDQLRLIARSIKEYGFTNPVLVDDRDNIIAGHGRLEAAKMLGMEKVPVVRLGYLDKKQKRAYVIADNKIALAGGWDMDLLEREMNELLKENFDLTLTGYEFSELQNMLDKSATEQLQAVQAAQPNDDDDDPGSPAAAAVGAAFDPKSEQLQMLDQKFNPALDEDSVAQTGRGIYDLTDWVVFEGEGRYDFPILRPEMLVKSDEIPDVISTWCGPPPRTTGQPPYAFTYGGDSYDGIPMATSLLHFYTNDEVFEPLWDEASTYIDAIRKLGVKMAVAPNYSVYATWPKAHRIWNTFRSRWVARYMQELGIKVIPDIQGKPSDLEWVCAGLVNAEVVSIQLHQKAIAEEKDTMEMKRAQIDATLHYIKPRAIVVYAPKDRAKLFPALSSVRTIWIEPRSRAMSRITRHAAPKQSAKAQPTD